MKAAQFFKTMGAICPTAQCHIPQDLQQQHSCLKLKSNTYCCCILCTHFTFSTLKVEAAQSSELFQPVCQIKWHGIPKERNVATYWHGNLKSYKLFYSNSRYVSRAHVRDSSKHVILGTQQYKPNEFATQITLNMDNAWGILRCIVDICMKQKDGKYLIMKDPNKPMIRLYDIPDNTFESDNEDADDEETGE